MAENYTTQDIILETKNEKERKRKREKESKNE
jgi:hypothetical protein